MLGGQVRHWARSATKAFQFRTAAGLPPYTATPFNGRLGAEVRDLDLTARGSQTNIPKAEIASDLDRTKVIVFRDQPASFADGDAHISVARSLGLVDEGRIYDNPKSPRSGVYRISNKPGEGKVLWEAARWHVDGLAFMNPVRFTSLFMVKSDAPAHVKYGTTKFVDAHAFFNEQDDRTKELWRNRYWLRDVKSDATYAFGSTEANRMSPLVYTHPSTGEVSLCVETPEEGPGFVDWVDGQWVVADPDASRRFVEELQLKLNAAFASCGYEHHWRQGDFMIWDNMAVIHKADSDAYLTPEQSRMYGTPYYERTLQRVTIQTKSRRDRQPSKAVEDEVIHGNAELVERLLAEKADFSHLLGRQ